MKVTPSCPLCNGKWKYFSGDGMMENMYYCGNSKHNKYSITFEDKSAYLELRINDLGLSIRWTFEKWGDIPAKTLTIGKDFSPYKNKRIEWFEPDFSNLDTLMEKFKWYLIFY